MMSDVMKANEALKWESPPSDKTDHRYMSLLFERDITPTRNICAGIVTIDPGQEQTRLSIHEGEEIYFVLKGKGQFVLDDRVEAIEKDTAIYVKPGTRHRAINIGDSVMRLYFENSPPVFGEVGAYKEFMKDWKQV